MSALRAPTKADLLDEMTNLIEALSDDDEIGPRTIRRWVNQAIRGAKVADDIASAEHRSGLRVADVYDYASDLQQVVRALVALRVSQRVITTHMNRALPVTEAKAKKMAADRARLALTRARKRRQTPAGASTASPPAS